MTPLAVPRQPKERKMEMDNFEKGLVAFLVLAMVLSGLGIICHRLDTRDYIENGYCLKPIIGYSMPVWQKCEENLK